MTTKTEVKPWDFSQVLGLLNDSQWRVSRIAEQHFATHPPQSHDSPLPKRNDPPPESNDRVARNDFAVNQNELGDFSQIWQYLGTSRNTSTKAELPSGQQQALNELPIKLDYASDGATYVNPAGNTKITSHDDSAGEQTTDSADATYESPSVSKKKRKTKKQRKREKKEREAAEIIRNATVSESEANNAAKRAPARKASVHVQTTPTSRPQVIRRYLAEHPVQPSDSAQEDKRSRRIVITHKKVLDQLDKKAEATSQTNASIQETPPQAAKAVSTHTTEKNTSPASKRDSSNIKPWPVANEQQANALKFMPSTITPPTNNGPPQVNTPGNKQIQQQPMSAPSHLVDPRSKGGKFVIEPKIMRSGEDRENTLFFKILNDFPEDRRSMISPMNLVKNKDVNGIHVFVDAKNIFIGFNDQLKRARNIPVTMHVPQVHLSFDAFALLLERHRPVAKRILAGSKPHVPAYDKAEALSYKTHIFDPVWKARELTERQKHFKAVDAGLVPRHAPAPPASDVAVSYGVSHPSGHKPGCTCGMSSSPEKAVPEFAKPAWVEQGVDEILHMEMLLSMVDHNEPSTMVVATGDAARAEYSDGFMAMVERALKKGWKVELVSWSKNISSLYRRREWAETWKEKFRIVELDDYAEELLDM